MGMDIVVGVFPELFDDADEDELDEQREEFAAMNQVLRKAGLPEHHEPETAGGGAPWVCEVGSWACVGYLRRVAASVALGYGLPEPISELPQKDPLIESYYAKCVTRRAASLAQADAPAQRTPQVELPPDQGVEIIEGPGFEHLMWHSDCTGYYLPIPFRPVIVLPKDPRWEQWGPWLGSSYTLLEECERLAEVLQFPRDMEIETMREHAPDHAAPDWRRYAVESFMCQVLINACQVSIASGCAVVYC